MTTTIQITGYAPEAHCDHCGRALRHGVRIDDGRTVGATCLANKLTAPRKHAGRAYRLAADAVVHMAKVVERVPAHLWGQYGVSDAGLTFNRAA